jgi:hypothetical protein
VVLDDRDCARQRTSLARTKLINRWLSFAIQSVSLSTFSSAKKKLECSSSKSILQQPKSLKDMIPAFEKSFVGNHEFRKIESRCLTARRAGLTKKVDGSAIDGIKDRFSYIAEFV